MSVETESDPGKTLAPDGRTYEEIARKCKMTVVEVEEYFERMKRMVGNSGVPITSPDDPLLKKKTVVIQLKKADGSTV
jgi:hypothetical protein